MILLGLLRIVGVVCVHGRRVRATEGAGVACRAAERGAGLAGHKAGVGGVVDVVLGPGLAHWSKALQRGEERGVALPQGLNSVALPWGLNSVALPWGLNSVALPRGLNSVDLP